MNTSQDNFDIVHFVKVIYKYRKQVFGTTLFAAVVSIIVSLLLPNYYKSQAVFYPKGLAIADRAAIFSENNAGEAEFVFYGTKHDANRILSLSNSSKIIDFTINYFNLAQHYGYDTMKTKYWRTKVKKEFNDNFKIIKTDKDAIEITLYDTDKDLCALMVNTMVKKIDEFNKKPYQENKSKIIESINSELIDKEKELDSLTKEMIDLRLHYNIKTIGSKDAITFTGDDVEKTEIFKVKYYRQQYLMKENSDLKKIAYQYDVSAKNTESSLAVLEYAYSAEKKSKPIRWLIVTLSTLITFLTVSFAALIFEQLRGIKWNEVSNEA